MDKIKLKKNFICNFFKLNVLGKNELSPRRRRQNVPQGEIFLRSNFC
jgi:hypothetical protein